MDRIQHNLDDFKMRVGANLEPLSLHDSLHQTKDGGWIMRTATAAKRIIQTFKEVKEKRSVLQKVRDFRGHIQIRHESEDFIIKTVQTSGELLRVLQLRHEIFVREWQGRKSYHGLDVDSYDFAGDHLMIIDKNTSEVVGTYRLLCSRFTDRFYSQDEFNIDEFLAQPFTKLELGRACVHPDYRDGNTIDMLWKGLSRYIEASNSRYLFGCASLKTTDPFITASLLTELSKKGSFKNEFSIRPTAKYEFKDFSWDLAKEMSHRELRDLMPPLLRSYLHAGAHVYGEPALDKLFACVDIFTVLDVSVLNSKFRQRYFPGH